jgi:type IV secretion system protein VirB10
MNDDSTNGESAVHNYSAVGESDGAIPSAGDSNGEVLGAPKGSTKSKSNVTRLLVVVIVIIGLALLVGAGIYFLKMRSRSAAAALEKVVAPQKNAEVTSTSIERTKAEILERERAEEEERKRKATALAATQKPEGQQVGTAPAALPTVISPWDRKMSDGLMLEKAGYVGSGGSGLSAATATPAQPGGGNPALQALAQAQARLQADASRMGQSGGAGGTTPSSDLASSLKPTTLASVNAGVLPNLDYLLKKGTDIPCPLKTGIDSTLPGFLTCTVMNDVYSANGRTLLIERGATIFGERRTELKQGQARTFVLWNRIDNPSGTYADLDSPGTDAMGYGGVPGDVDNHFMERFGGAIMVSLISDLTSFLIARENSGSSSSGGTSFTLNNTTQGSQNMATEVLRNSINIPPTLRTLPGTITHVLVARDVSFESVYRLLK